MLLHRKFEKTKKTAPRGEKRKKSANDKENGRGKLTYTQNFIDTNKLRHNTRLI